MDPSAIEELFERNADMRLLELRHADSGRAARAVRHVATFGGDAGTVADVTIPDAPLLRVGVAAAPADGVIPGAVIGVSIDVFNDGRAPAPEAALVLSVPLEATYRPGTLRIDGREPLGPERLFADGLPIARLPGGTSTKVVFQLQVLPGIHPLYLQPRLNASGAPVVGTAGVSIKRAVASAPAPASTPRPFYELEDDEHEPGEAESYLSIIPPVLPPEPAAAAAPPPPETVVIMPPKGARRESPRAKPAPQPVALSPAVPPPPSPPPAPSSAAPPELRMTRYRTLGPNDLALLERLFAPERPGIIAHFMMISTLACIEPEAGPEPGGYAAFLRGDGEALGRALVLARLGKKAEYRVEEAALGALDLPWEPLPVRSPGGRGAKRRLRRDLREPEHAAIAGLVRPSNRDPQLRLRIALLALAGATLEGVSKSHADDCMVALASYRSALLAWLVPLCVASSTAPALGLPEPPPNVDHAGRRVVAVLRAAAAG